MLDKLVWLFASNIDRIISIKFSKAAFVGLLFVLQEILTENFDNTGANKYKQLFNNRNWHVYRHICSEGKYVMGLV